MTLIETRKIEQQEQREHNEQARMVDFTKIKQTNIFANNDLKTDLRGQIARSTAKYEPEFNFTTQLRHSTFYFERIAEEKRIQSQRRRRNAAKELETKRHEKLFERQQEALDLF